jgi:nitroreductase/NAD-dependent dihydropyrimidine dehydrogenase PreA subunit
MSLINVNTKSCNQDGICAAVCPANLIDFTKGEFPSPVENIDKLCIRCGHCVAACPSGSLHHADIPLEQCPPVKKELLLSAEQTEQFLRNRRSIRNYRDQSVPKELLQKLIEQARYAPTGHNTQTVEWMVLTDREEMNKLIGLVGDWMRWMLVNMSKLALSMHMDKALERIDAGEDVVLRGAPVLIIAHAKENDLMAPTSCTIALSHLELAATGMELGGCWAGYFNSAVTSFPPLKEALGLPDGHHCFGAMMVGYPTFRYHRLPERKIPNIIWRGEG